MNTKKDILQKHKVQNQKFSTLMSFPQSIRKPKNVAVYFKDVKCKETFCSQDQKLVETTILWQLYWDENTPAEIR